MTQRTPLFYDSTADVHRPIDSGDTLPPTSIPISAQTGNKLQIMSDGIYLGRESGLVIYVDSVAGVDTNAGTKALPLKTIAGSFTLLNSMFPGSDFSGQGVTVALKSGGTYPHTVDMTLQTEEQLEIAFYGDTNYGDFNSAQVAGTTNPWNMADLVRPIIVPAVSTTASLGLNKIFGFNLQGGSLSLKGVQINLPAAPTNPLISDVSAFADYVRSIPSPIESSLIISGVVANMTDTTAYWGLVGCQSRSTLFLTQFASQLLVQGAQVTGSSSSAAQAVRTYFIKFYADYPGNNQNDVPLSATSATSSNGSGFIRVSWSDTESLTVTGSKVNQASYPVSFSSGLGLINYVYGVITNSASQPLNLQSSRLI